MKSSIEHEKSIFIKWLKKEVSPALGCTEPVAIAFAAARAAKAINQPACRIKGFISENLYKNAMGVTIPGTRASGVNLAAAIGAVGGNADKGLETLKGINEKHIETAYQLVNAGEVEISAAETESFIHIDLTVYGATQHCRVVINGTHTNMTHLYINDIEQPIVRNPEANAQSEELPVFSLKEAFDFISNVDFSDIAFMLEARDINEALSAEGQQREYGLNINGILKNAIAQGIMHDDLMSKILIDTVAASDARMGGAPVPAMSNFGSGNQGIAATMPVVVVARHLEATAEELARALALSHLTAISIHARYTRLSALCAASTASMGAAAGMGWLFTKDFNVINAAITNMISDISGIICDGASNSCAMKVSTVSMSAFKSVLMAHHHRCASANDGIVAQDVEVSINNLCHLVVHPMTHTDKEIINIMTHK
ncbi:TPA: serine dehydratase subunit alpha family protein [Serratia odorifera]